MQNTAYIIEYKCLRQLVAKKKQNSNKSCSKYGAEVENDARSVGELQTERKKLQIHILSPEGRQLV